MRFWSGLFKLAFFLALVFYGGGGWYFSEQLRTDALEPNPFTLDYQLTVVSVGDGSITLRRGSEGNRDLFRPAVYGLEWNEGYGRLGEITDETSSDVTRRFEVLSGSQPEENTLAGIDPYAFTGDPTEALGIDYRAVTYQSPLGDMSAWEVAGSTNTWVIHIHGRGASPAEALRMMPAIVELGHNQLAITYRNDPDEPADPSGFYRYGQTEWQDVDGAVQYAIDEGAERIMLAGYSTGGAHALAFLYNSSKTDKVVGMILDSPNLDFSKTVDFGASQRDLPFTSIAVPSSLAWAAKQIAALRFDVEWDRLDYITPSDRLTVPVLVFHGDADTTVPIERSREFAAKRSSLVTLIEVAGAEHVQSWNVDPEKYQGDVQEFLDKLP